MIGIGVIGYGYWGPNLVRNFAETPGAEMVAVCDLSPERLELVQKRYPAIKVYTDYREMIDNPSIGAIAVATPVHTHYPPVLYALGRNRHVFCEKPLTDCAKDAMSLIAEAERKNLTFMVDHTFVYTGAVRKIKELIDSGAVGDLYYYDSVRVNLGLFQHDVNVLWDLAVHDLSIMDYLLPHRPVAVQACAMSHIPESPQDVAYLTMHYREQFIAHVHVNWLAPVKIRRTLIGGSARMIVFDDLEPSEKVKIYDSGVRLETDPENIYKMRVGYRTGDVHSPALDRTEALKLETRHFIDCICTGKKPLTDAHAGLRVVRILEAAEKSLEKGGVAVEIEA